MPLLFDHVYFLTTCVVTDHHKLVLTQDEFADVLEYLDFKVSDAKQERLFKKYDEDKSGFIDYEEVKKHLLYFFVYHTLYT